MVISGAYFNIAMHQTEAKLARKTRELVAAEKRATLGQLATEMAHEIQNPLNFVNNFSELSTIAIKDLDQAQTEEEKKLIIEETYANEGPKLKRIRPRAQGRAYRILKPTCHITVIVKSI